jgi:hypothetical protein
VPRRPRAISPEPEVRAKLEAALAFRVNDPVGLLY